MIFVDSSVWIDYFNGRPSRETELLDRLLGTEPLVTGDVVLAEVLQGFRRDADYRTARDLLLTLGVMNVLDTELAIKSADNFRRLRKRGITVRKTLDCMREVSQTQMNEIQEALSKWSELMTKAGT